ncbi:GntR family transcriptional regulator [Fredinandcohnia onubensis]|uniref:GntR family transcriptional regulator n=1 Tax=Fredinandcohnia onubensis TaxID=1571209 RepID=UPI000C0BF5D3|nr:GntR family transcriptional regulator [Fredinandcohnia onubensis]
MENSPYEKLKIEILNGTLLPGTRLREEEIAKKLKLSRTPIREAIRRLAIENLVKLSPNKGATVREYTIDDIKHSYDLRAMIEGYAASLAARNNNLILINELEKYNKEYEMKANYYLKNRIKTDDKLMDLIDSNRKFHDVIIKLAENKYISQMVSLLLTLPLTFQSFYWFDEKEFLNSVITHGNIASAIKNGEADQARVLMSSHVLQGRDYVLRNVYQEFNS